MKTNLEVFIASDKESCDVNSVVSMFNGRSSKGLQAEIEVFVPPKVKGWDKDYAMLIDVFNKADPSSYTIICKDTAISTSTSETILNVIETAMETCSFDLFYLAKWMDRCDQFSNMRDVGDQGMKIVDTVSPNGFLCIMFSPKGKEKFLQVFPPFETEDCKANPITKQPLGQVLNSRISMRNSKAYLDESRPTSAKRFSAITCHPSIINFDITKRRHDIETLKTVECREIPKEDTTKTKPSGGLGFFWFIVIVLIVIVLVWAIYKMGYIGKSGGVENYYGDTLKN